MFCGNNVIFVSFVLVVGLCKSGCIFAFPFPFSSFDGFLGGAIICSCCTIAFAFPFSSFDGFVFCFCCAFVFVIWSLSVFFFSCDTAAF